MGPSSPNGDKTVISTNNPELDAAFAELQLQVQTLSEQNALKAGNIAGLRFELKTANEKIVELEKKAAPADGAPRPE